MAAPIFARIQAAALSDHAVCLTARRAPATNQPRRFEPQLAGRVTNAAKEWAGRPALSLWRLFRLASCAGRPRDLRGSLHRVTNAKALKAKALCPNLRAQEGPSSMTDITDTRIAHQQHWLIDNPTGQDDVACRQRRCAEPENPDLLPTLRVLQALAQCHEQTYRLYAEALGIPLDGVQVRLQAALDLRGLYAAADRIRAGFSNLQATVEISSPADIYEIERLRVTVERHAPVLDIVRNPTPVRIELVLTHTRTPRRSRPETKKKGALMSISSKHPETIVLHAGYRRDAATGAVAVPIYQTTSYQFDDTEHAADLFALKEFGNIYTRIMNPTPTCSNSAWRRSKAASRRWRWARARRRPRSRCRTSPVPATTSSARPISMAAPGICSRNTFKDMGIEMRFVDPADPENFRRATDDRTRAYYAETLPNPEAEGVPDRGGRGDRPLARRAADHGQHRLPDPVQAVRAWRGDRRLFDDQVYRRPRHLDRRRADRRRQFRLGEARRALPRPQPAGPELSRRDVDPGGEAARPDRLHHQGARHAAARHRRAA